MAVKQLGRWRMTGSIGPIGARPGAQLRSIGDDDVVRARTTDSIDDQEVVLDMDSSESPTYGTQEGSAYNGHFGCTCYHPLFVFNQLGDLERCALRSGSVHSAADWRNVLEPVVARYRGTVKRCYFRGDAAFAIYEFLEAEGYGYAIRLPTNSVLQSIIGLQ